MSEHDAPVVLTAEMARTALAGMHLAIYEKRQDIVCALRSLAEGRTECVVKDNRLVRDLAVGGGEK